MTATEADAPTVVRVITRLNIGGPARQALSLTRDLRPEFRTVLAAGTPAPDEGELSDPDVTVRPLPLVRPLRPREDARALVAVRRLLTLEAPAIVHTHMAKAGAVTRSVARTIRPRPRTVHTFHGHVLEGYFHPAVERGFVELERLLARATDVLVAISPEVRDALLDLRIGRPEQYRLIPLGFDLSALRTVTGHSGLLRERLGIGEQPLVGILGRLAPIKDHDTLLTAFRDVNDAHLVILGDGPLRAELEARAMALGLANRVHFLGWWDDVASAMADLDVAVLSSRNEGTPASAIEAGAAGRPVVGTNVGGMRSVIDDGVNGLLVPPGDPAALANALHAVLSDPARAASMGAAGRASSERFSLERLVSDIRALYRELLP